MCDASVLVLRHCVRQNPPQHQCLIHVDAKACAIQAAVGVLPTHSIHAVKHPLRHTPRPRPDDEEALIPNGPQPLGVRRKPRRAHHFEEVHPHAAPAEELPRPPRHGVVVALRVRQEVVHAAGLVGEEAIQGNLGDFNRLRRSWRGGEIGI